MTSKLALIEWIPETVTLKSIFFEDSSCAQAVQSASTKYFDFINSVDETNKPNHKENNKPQIAFAEKHNICFQKYGRDLVISEFNKIQNNIPWDVLRRFIRSLSASTEAYFVLRNQFITSYAAASVCQYILGIGDRHLGNWMLDLKSGSAIGIDFGMAFGHATMNICKNLIYK
jgi:DNA-dependent protein kinase catalytic subunit